MFQPNMLLLNVNILNLDKTNILHDNCNYPNLDFLCLVEIGSKKEAIDFLRIDNCNLISYYITPNKKCGGVGLWCKKHLNVKKVNLDVMCSKTNFEYCIISCKIDNLKTFILNCYRSPSGDKDIFFKKMSDVLNMLFKPEINIIVCGDFNFDVLNVTVNSDFVNLHKFVLSNFN